MPHIRPGRDSDDFPALIAACWAQYPGLVVDLDGEDHDLRALATHYKNGALWRRKPTVRFWA